MTIHDPATLNDPETQWLRLSAAVSPAQLPALTIAYQIAARVHQGQFRKTAQQQPIPYLVHPLRVARILCEEWQTPHALAIQAALLHDTLEDCPPQERANIAAEITEQLGADLCQGVYTLTKPAPAPAEAKAARDARYFKELFAAPDWVRFVKCADRVDNLRDALAWGNPAFWERYNSETIGWHLYLARDTSPIAEVALFKALVDGERAIRGRVPVWADGHLIDPVAASLIPEHIARAHEVIGLAIQGATLIVGMCRPEDRAARETVELHLRRTADSPLSVRPIPISPEALEDAFAAGLYGGLRLP